MRVLLVKPPERSAFNFGTYSLGVLAAAVRELAAVEILDATDLAVAAAVSEVWRREPRIVGVTVMGLASVKPAIRFLHELGRRRDPGAVLLAGGHGASMLPDLLLQAGADAVVLGEGERTFAEVVAGGLRPGAPGLACRVEGRLVVGPQQRLIQPLDSLPPPARDLMPRPLDGVHLLETSRGCPHACAFCEATRFHRRRWRPFSPPRVAAEVHRLVEEYGAWVIHVADDNFAASPRRVLRLCRELAPGPRPAFFLVSARGDDLIAHPELLPAMAKAGFLRVSVGVESLRPETAAAVGKPIPLATYREAFGRMRELGMFSMASLIVGLPGETALERERAVELAVEVGPDAARFLPFLPLPGTPLSGGRAGPDPEPADEADAEAFTAAFFRHAEVQGRLLRAAEGSGVRAILARATLDRRPPAAPRLVGLELR